MGRHDRKENPVQPNAILHMGARPLPDGNIEVMVVIRLFDNSYQLSKIVSLNEYCTQLEGLDLCAKTAIHQIHQRELMQVAQENAAAASSSPRSASAPDATPAPSDGSSTGDTKGHGAPTWPNAPMNASANAGIKPIPIPPQPPPPPQ